MENYTAINVGGSVDEKRKWPIDVFLAAVAGNGDDHPGGLGRWDDRPGLVLSNPTSAGAGPGTTHAPGRRTKGATDESE